MKKKSETELAKALVQYFKKQEWVVYQEVQTSSSQRIADIVATNNDIVWVVECKTAMGLRLLEQANHWLKQADFVSICIPQFHRRNKNSRAASFGKEICKVLGIGCFEITKANKIIETIEPIRQKTNSKYLLDSLCEEQKTNALAGSNSGGQWTAFKRTKNLMIEYVKLHPGCELKTLIKNIDHHYVSEQSAYSALKKMIEKGVINEMYLDYSEKNLRIFPKENSSHV